MRPDDAPYWPLRYFSALAWRHWRRDRLLEGAEDLIQRQAELDAQGHPFPEMKWIRFTEQHPDLVLLYNAARTGQFDAWTLRRFPDEWLVWLDGHQTPQVELTDEQRSKLSANAHRASAELQRRQAWQRAIVAAAVAVLLGVIGFVGGRATSTSSDPIPTQLTTTTNP